jgi:hypothetical protein
MVKATFEGLQSASVLVRSPDALRESAGIEPPSIALQHGSILVRRPQGQAQRAAVATYGKKALKGPT